MTTLVVLGAGEIGGAVARQAAAHGVARRVVLVDDRGDAARGKALDIRQAGPVEGYDTEVLGSDDAAAVVGAAIVVVADRHGAPGLEWQGDDGLLFLARVRQLNPRALIVCAGPAQLDLVERFVVERGADRTRILGSAPEALRGAITALTSLAAGCTPREVSLTLLGRPPATAFVPWNDASIAGQRASEVLEPPEITRLDARLPMLWPPGPFSLGAAAAAVARLALTGSSGWPSVFVVPEAIPNAQVRGVVLPAVLGPQGVRRLLVPTLSTRDRVRLESAQE